ncbi:butyrate kinase [Zhenhengia yiwuensis]|uniref:Probable butyrate kinase n=1 Tax=Zhenhengia yiwuensis TaxID=2763666 RepID=A0A926EJL6_9FIRM|nr:butyrate kinase [Zhenhengia yiwuensis]MBC8581614.1 butyrate kinase [Zhenhengia yiwuensis]
MPKYNILTINPGSTSTKIALFKDNELEFEQVLRHPAEELNQFSKLIDQYEYRKEKIINFLEEKNITLKDLDAISCRGGLIGPIPSGTYTINDSLFTRLSTDVVHASNLAGIIGYNLSKELDIPSYITDPVTVDEMAPIAKVTGIPGIERKSKFHALNQKAIARRAAKQLNRKYDESNFIVIHIGGGISIGAHEKGKVIDVNNVIDGDGPMAPTRAGSIPVEAVIDLCFSGKYTRTELKEYVSQRAGLTDYLGTSDVRDVQEMMEQGNEQAKMLYEAMAYQICKNVGAMATVLKGKIDAIVVTGGVAYSKQFIRLLKERIDFLGEVIVIPGEEEMLALAEGALRVLTGEEEAKTI